MADHPDPDPLARLLALEARKLNLNALSLSASPEDVVRAFAEVVLEELAARGLLEGETEVGCWARPRLQGN